MRPALKGFALRHFGVELMGSNPHPKESVSFRFPHDCPRQDIDILGVGMCHSHTPNALAKSKAREVVAAVVGTHISMMLIATSLDTSGFRPKVDLGYASEDPGPWSRLRLPPNNI